MTSQTVTHKQMIKKPRTKPAEVRLDELMTAAQSLFLSQGVDQTTVSEIVEKAGVAKGTFYHYFDSKNEILQALGRRYTQHFITMLQQAVDSCAPDDWIQKLRCWVITSVNGYVATYQVHDVVYTSHHHHNRKNQDKNAIVDQLLSIIEGGIDAGLWVPAQPRLVALLIYSGVHGATDDIIGHHIPDSMAFAENLADACLCMLQPVSGAVG